MKACTVPPSDTESLLDSGQRFAWELYCALKKPGENLIYSPFSVTTALAMLYAGARTETATELATALHFELDPGRLHPAYQALIADLSASSDGYELSVANSLWIQDGSPVRGPFLEQLETHYGARPGILDFKAEAEGARRAINAWVEDRTQGKIENLFPEGSVNHLTRLVLANAIYFKGKWESPFDEGRTRDAPFTLASGDRVDVPLMFEKNRFGYHEEEALQVLELPYRGDRLSLVIFLPRATDGLPAVESSLTAERLSHLMSALVSHEVLVYVPRFELSSSFPLSAALGALGVQGIFAEGADFSGIDGTRDLYVQAAVHEATIEVNEEGTEAAAASGMAMGVTSARPARPLTFRADHPFLFLIRSRDSGQILFLGRVHDPRG